MTDNPYINKQNWGRDLLDRLNNFSDDDGSFNVWEELPTLGKNGQPLGQEHAGYTGIIVLDSASQVTKWNGSFWEKILDIPFITSGDNIVTKYFVAKAATRCYMFKPLASSDYFFVVRAEFTENFFTISKINSQRTVNWTCQITKLPDSYIDAYFQNSLFLPAIEDQGNFIFCCTMRTSSQQAMNLYSVGVSGTLNWTTSIGTAASGIEFTGHSLVAANQSVAVFVLTSSNSEVVLLNKISGAILNRRGIEAQSGIKSWLTTNGDIVAFSIESFTVFYSVYSKTDSSNRIARLNISLLFPTAIFNNLDHICQIYEQRHLFVILNKNATDKYSVYLYNANTLSVSEVIALTQENTTNIEFNKLRIVSASLVNSKYSILTTNGSAFISLIVENNSTSTDVTIPAAPGVALINSVPSAYSFSDWCVKIRTKTTGTSVNKKTVLSAGITKNNSKITALKNISLLANDGDAANIASLTSFSELSSEDFSAKIANIDLIKLPSAHYRLGENTDYPANGISSQLFHLCSYVDGSNPISNIGYSALSPTLAGRLFSCLLFNLYLSGNSFTSGAISNTNPGAAIIFDQWVGRLFIENSASTSMDATLSNFPAGNGIVVTSANNIGIGTSSPGFKLDVNGEMRATVVRNSGGVITSDPRLKVNMISLAGEDLWSVCQQLNPITFLYKPDFGVKINEVEKDENGNDVISVISQKWPLPQGIQYGYNAAEVELLFPELVSEDPQGIKYLNSGALFPIFQAAATSKIQSLESEVESLKQLVQSLVTRIEVLENA